MSQPTMTVSPLTESSVTLKDLPLSAIHVADNYRSAINSEGLEALAASIVAGGLIQPVTVRPLDEPIEGRTHALVAGFRRFAAHELSGLPTILATVRKLTPQMAEAIRLAENIMRENPHPADEALAVGKLSREGMNTEAIASYLGKNPRWVSQRRAISELLPEWLKDLREDKLTLGGAEELSRWPAEVQRRCLSQRGNYVVTEAGVRSWVSREKQQLGSAPWPLEDATLYPSAGACSSCPKRSSCNTVLFADLVEAGTDSCLDSACWKTKLGLRVEQVITEQQELAGQQPVVRLSSNYWQPPTGSIAADKYEVVKRKKGTVVGVYVDGAQAGKVVRVELAQDTAKAVAAGKTELSQGEKNRDARHQRLLKETGKQVLAERCYHALQAPTAEAKQGRIRVLASVVAESLMQGRNLDLVTLAALASTWKWEPVGKKGPDTKGLPYREWVVAQVLKCAPTEALLAQLLLFSVTHRGLGSEWNNYQQTAAALIKAPQLQEGLAEATEQEFERLYDPRTLRLRKEPLEATPVQQLPVEESDEQADEEHGIAA